MSTETPERKPIVVPTPDLVAESLTAGDNDYDEAGCWWPSLTSDGNVLRIGITPADEDGERCEKVHFEAHVFEVEPSPPVAAEAVKLPAEVARELAYESVGGGIDGWTVVVKKQTRSSPWTSHHRLVIRNERGEHFAAYYRKGLTGNQHEQPWEYDKTAWFEPVERAAKVVREYAWVKPWLS